MKKYKLIVVGGDSPLTGERDNVVKGFAAAEDTAKQLLAEYRPHYSDAYVACFEEGETIFYWNYLIYTRDIDGVCHWKMMVMGEFCPLYDRFLTDSEEDDLEQWRNEVERSILDLSEAELKQLRTEVHVGSLFLSDYQNSFDLDENEVYTYCASYDDYLGCDDDGNPLPESEWKKDTPEEFAYYVLNSY